MNSKYNIKIDLECITCGGQDFNYNEDKSYVKCNLCDKEYLNGYDELVEMNEEKINGSIQSKKSEIVQDLREDINKMFKDAFKGSKFLKFK